MVFYFYQEKQDYKTALTYASNWLNIYPNDVEISLYQARCYRQMDDKVSLETANILIDKLRIHAGNNVFASRLFREKAMIAERLGDIDSAITFYEQGIAVEGRRPYPENYIGLARILVDQAEMLPEDSTIQQEVATRAVELLNIAREESSTFERLHLGLYAHALIEAGQEERALPLLEEALAERPEDGRLNFRMAEILRKKGMFRESEKFAKVALSNHIDEALLTLANILYSEGIDLQSSPTSNDASTMFLRAIDYTTQYKSQVTRAGSIEVADGIISKIFRALDDWDAAEKILTKYKNSSGQYIVYEQCKVYLRKSEIAQSRGDQASAIEELNIARSCIANVKFGLSKQLAEVNSEINLRQKLLSVL
jgi:tetratricopeptide (TPR) repeat protein